MAKTKRRANGHRIPRSEYIRSLVDTHKIERARIAQMAGVSIHTVTAWLRSPGALSHREPKQAVVELLSIKTRKPLPQNLVA